MKLTPLVLQHVDRIDWHRFAWSAQANSVLFDRGVQCHMPRGRNIDSFVAHWLKRFAPLRGFDWHVLIRFRPQLQLISNFWCLSIVHLLIVISLNHIGTSSRTYWRTVGTLTASTEYFLLLLIWRLGHFRSTTRMISVLVKRFCFLLGGKTVNTSSSDAK